MQIEIVLTVSESKRLIAKGVAAHPLVRRVLKKGNLAVAKGTTDSYVVEEVTGKKIDKKLYCTGTTTPRQPLHKVRTQNKLDDLIVHNGKVVSGISAVEYVAQMGAGDVFVKGANALNYEKKQAGILIGHPTGGTIGAAIGTCISRRINLVIPVGLEKSIPVDIPEVAGRISAAGKKSRGATLWPVHGVIVTEIEAIELLAGVEAIPCAAGGINGAEGSIRLALFGTTKQIQAAEKIVSDIYGEPPFIS